MKLLGDCRCLDLRLFECEYESFFEFSNCFLLFFLFILFLFLKRMILHFFFGLFWHFLFWNWRLHKIFRKCVSRASNDRTAFNSRKCFEKFWPQRIQRWVKRGNLSLALMSSRLKSLLETFWELISTVGNVAISRRCNSVRSAWISKFYSIIAIGVRKSAVASALW